MQLRKLWLWLSLIVALIVPYSAHAAVSLDACASADGFTSSGTSGTLGTQTVGAGANRALTVFLLWGSAVPTGITVTWDSGGSNQAMTQSVIQSSGTQTAAIYTLVAPTSGNKTLAIAWTNAAQMIVHSCAWTNVNQTGGVTSFPGAASSTAVNSINVTSATGDVVVGTEVIGTSFTTTTGNTVFTDNGRSIIAAAAQWQTGAATVSTGGTPGSGTTVAIAGVDIKAAGGGVACPATRSLLGVGC